MKDIDDFYTNLETLFLSLKKDDANKIISLLYVYGIDLDRLFDLFYNLEDSKNKTQKDLHQIEELEKIITLLSIIDTISDDKYFLLKDDIECFFKEDSEHNENKKNKNNTIKIKVYYYAHKINDFFINLLGI